MTLAETEDFVRLFVDEGPPMADLLKALESSPPHPGYLDELIAAATTITPRRSTPSRLIDPLSERELDVMRLLGGDLAGPEIARRLSISLNTLRTHTKNVYSKLGVSGRRAAMQRAHELDLIPGPHLPR